MVIGLVNIVLVFVQNSFTIYQIAIIIYTTIHSHHHPLLMSR